MLLFPWKKNKDHKYSRGRVIVYGGQKEFSGATILSAQAALRTGTGSVKIICSKNTLEIQGACKNNLKNMIMLSIK